MSDTVVKKYYRSLLVPLAVFIIYATIVFLSQNRDSINWVEDYQSGLKLAREQNKPALLAFYKANARFCWEMTQNTYNNPDVKKYVEENFIPILIDVDKQPEIAKHYSINYYPTHYLKYPDSNKLIGPQMGFEHPGKFIQTLKGFLEGMKLLDR